MTEDDIGDPVRGPGMNRAVTADFIRRIPKTDLHVHLDGSLRVETLIELARQQRVPLPSHTPEGLRELVYKGAYANLAEYLQGFRYTCAVMRDSESLERIAFELAEDNLAEGVRYIEVRFAPQLHAHGDFTLSRVLEAVNCGLDRAKQAHNKSEAVRRGGDIPFEYGIIVCALRSFSAAMSPYYGMLMSCLSHMPRKRVFAIASRELAMAAVHIRREEGLPIVGFDLAGEEAGYPAEDHRESFEFAHRHFLQKTVHAGEAYGPESIFQAITVCHASRIGHGTFLFASDLVRDATVENPREYVDLLAEYIAARRITIEVNLTSNLQTTPSIASVADHPLRQMMAHSLSVSLCTDNRLVSNTTVSRELHLAVEAFGLGSRELRNLVVAGFKGSFFPHPYVWKRAYVRQVINRYEQLERELAPL